MILCGNKTDLPRQVSTAEGRILSEKENMVFFEISAKTASGVNDMMYNCIVKLPFFDQIKVPKENLIKELENSNCNNKEGGGIFDIEKEYENNPQNSSNAIMTKKLNEDETKRKRKCEC